MQVIVIVEASKESKSDWMYINSLLKYKYDVTGHKLSPIYLNGKGRYKNVYKKVEELKKNYYDSSVVVMCIDVDSISNVHSDVKLYDKIYRYAISHKYKFVWFNRDIEDVFRNERVSKSQKTKKAIEFIQSNKIKNVNFDKLNKERRLSNQTSNILKVFDEIFNRK